jgi:hypothetical protein
LYYSSQLIKGKVADICLNRDCSKKGRTRTLSKISEFQLALGFLVWQVISFGKHTTKPTHTTFEIKIFTYGKAAAN